MIYLCVLIYSLGIIQFVFILNLMSGIQKRDVDNITLLISSLIWPVMIVASLIIHLLPEKSTGGE